MVQRGVSAVICGIFVCVSVLFAANTAYAEIADTTDCESWFNDNNYDTAQIQCNGLSGCLRFFYAKNCLYCCLSYSAEKMSGNEDISLEINISNINRNYTVCFSATEDSDYPCSLTKYFTRPTNMGQDIYFMLEFTSKEDKGTDNQAEINLKIDSKSYYIALIDMPADKETAVQEENEQNEYERQGKNEETTKFTYSANDDDKEDLNENTTKSGSDSGKYVYNENAQENNNDTATQGTYSAADGTLLDVPVEKQNSFSTPAKAMFGLSGAFALSGAAVLIKHAVKIREAKKTELDTQQKDNSCE